MFVGLPRAMRRRQGRGGNIEKRMCAHGCGETGRAVLLALLVLVAVVTGRSVRTIVMIGPKKTRDNQSRFGRIGVNMPDCRDPLQDKGQHHEANEHRPRGTPSERILQNWS